MKKTYWVIPGKLAGRAGPAADPWELEEFLNAGISTIVSLDDQVTASAIEAAGLKHLPRYMPSSYPTSPMLVNRFVDLVKAIVEEINALLESGESILVHCYVGRDRTGLVLCGLLMHREKLTADQALKRVRSKNANALTGPGVLDVLHELDLQLAGWRNDR